MAWVESHQQLERHPKTQALMAAMNWDVDLTIGRLHRFWWWVLEFAPIGNLTKYSDTVIAASCGVSADMSGHFVDTLSKIGFIDRCEGGVVRVHNWIKYAGRYLKGTKYKRHQNKLDELVALYELPLEDPKKEVSGDMSGQIRNKPPLPNLTIPNHIPPIVPPGGQGPGRSLKKKTPTTPEAKRLGGIFHRRESTAWNDKEIRAFKKIVPIDSDELSMLEAYYREEKGNPENCLRRDLFTLLNNYQGEIDRAKAFKPTRRSLVKKSTEPEIEPEGFRAWYSDMYTERPDAPYSVIPSEIKEIFTKKGGVI